MRAKELREKTVEELRKELTGLLREQFDLRIQKANEQLKRFHRFGQNRRDIARIKTVLTEKRVKHD